MFNYSWKTKTLLILLLLFTIFLVIFLVRQHKAKAADLKVVEQVQIIAEGMENYFSKYNAYPDNISMDLSKVYLISDQGINIAGDYTYYQGRLDWDRSVILKSSNDSYVVEFQLTEKWNIWNIDSREGGFCNVSSGLNMACTNKPATFLDYFR